MEKHKDAIFLCTKNELLRGDSFITYRKHSELFMLMRGIEAKIIQNHGYLRSHLCLSLECITRLIWKRFSLLLWATCLSNYFVLFRLIFKWACISQTPKRIYGEVGHVGNLPRNELGDRNEQTWYENFEVNYI